LSQTNRQIAPRTAHRGPPRSIAHTVNSSTTTPEIMAEVEALARLLRARRFTELAEGATAALARHPGAPDLWRLLAAAGQGLGLPELSAAAVQMLIRLCPERGNVEHGVATVEPEPSRAPAPDEADIAENSLSSGARRPGSPLRLRAITRHPPPAPAYRRP